MLIELTIENYLSIKDRTTFSMQSAPYLKRLKDSNTFNSDPVNLLKSAVIFGANGSGKTNLFNALKELRSILVNYDRKPMKNLKDLPFKPFKRVSDFESSFTTFEIIFLLNSNIYKYIIKYNQDGIEFESLSLIESDESIIFERKKNNNRYIYNLDEGINDYESTTRKNVPYLSVLADNNNSLAIEVMLWLTEDIVFIGPSLNLNYYKHMLNKIADKKIKKKLLNFMKIADFNIIDFEIRKRKQAYPDKVKEMLKVLELDEVLEDEHLEMIDLFTVYKNYNHLNEEVGTSVLDAASYESRGTQKMIILSLILIEAFEEGKTVIIDEFDNAFHFEISHFLLKIFNSNIHNTNSQFILNTHDLSLMDRDVLRVDQIWFVEKNKENKTELYSLYDFNDSKDRARSDVAYLKSYLKGQYGAVPIINDSILEFDIFNTKGE